MAGPFLRQLDLHLPADGTRSPTYRRLGAHLAELDGVAGAHLAVLAPNAERVLSA